MMHVGHKNSDFNLGILLRDLRLQKGISQSELADSIGYSIRQIQRFESENYKITQEGITILSNFYNVDLNYFIKISDSFKDYDDYNKFVNLRKLIENSKYDKMQIIYNLLIHDKGFKEGEKLQLVLYCKAALLSRLDNNYSESNKVCLEALAVFDYLNYIELLKHDILTDTSYPVLALIRYNFIKLQDEKASNTLTIAMYNHFKNFVFNRSIPLKNDMHNMKKYYIASTYNLASMFYKHNHYLRALILVDKSIDLSNEFGILNLVPHLYKLKFKIYYMMADFEKSLKFYSIFINLCEITDNLEYLNRTKKIVESRYPLLIVT